MQWKSCMVQVHLFPFQFSLETKTTKLKYMVSLKGSSCSTAPPKYVHHLQKGLVRSRECLYNLSTTISNKMQNEHDQRHTCVYALDHVPYAFRCLLMVLKLYKHSPDLTSPFCKWCTYLGGVVLQLDPFETNHMLEFAWFSLEGELKGKRWTWTMKDFHCTPMRG